MFEDYVYPFTASSAGPGVVEIHDTREGDFVYLSAVQAMQLMQSLSAAIHESMVKAEIARDIRMVKEIPGNRRHLFTESHRAIISVRVGHTGRHHRVMNRIVSWHRTVTQVMGRFMADSECIRRR